MNITRVLARRIPAWLRNALSFARGGITFSGPYVSWTAAALHSEGYDADSILNRVLETTRKVERGEFAFERDSVGIAEHETPSAILAALEACGTSGLRVLDFGGSLGTLYRRVLADSVPVNISRWTVCEQPHFAKAGASEFSGDTLEFVSSIEDAASGGPFDLLVLSGVLPYLRDPISMLRRLLAIQPKHVLIDRTPMLTGTSVLLVQHVPASIYRASYPMWVLSRDDINQVLAARYVKISEHECAEVPVHWDHTSAAYRGSLWKLAYTS